MTIVELITWLTVAAFLVMAYEVLTYRRAVKLHALNSPLPVGRLLVKVEERRLEIPTVVRRRRESG